MIYDFNYLLGLTQVSGFNRPSEAVENLEFKDNSINFDEDNKFAVNMDYNYRPGIKSSIIEKSLTCTIF